MRDYRFYNTAQMNAYLNNSVIRVDNEPVYVLEGYNTQSGQPKLAYCFLGKRRESKNKSVLIYSKNVDLSPIPLGFMNNITDDKNQIAVVNRRPARNWKMGLSDTNMKISNPIKYLGYTPGPTTEAVIVSENLRRTVIGLYPGFEQALKDLKKGPFPNSIAFARHFCLEKEDKKAAINLWYYKYEKAVGCIDESIPILNQKFNFLAEHLEESL